MNQKTTALTNQRTKILLVEDEPTIAAHLSDSLIEIGYEVPALASAAEEAFLAASATRPDVVLMDINLKGQSDGIEAATKIYSELRIPVVFLTAHDDMLTLHRAQEADPFGYMTKPVVRVDLANSIETALRRHRKQHAQQVREAWLEAQLKSVSGGLIAANHDGIVWFINPEGERLLGVSAQDIVGTSFGSAVPLRHRLSGRQAEDLVRLALLQGTTIDIGEDYVVDGPGHRRISGQIAVSKFAGEPIGVVFTFRDTTVERYRQDSLHNNVVTADSLDCARYRINLFQCLRELEPQMREGLSKGKNLSIAVEDSVYPIIGNHDVLGSLIKELVGRAEQKLGEQGSVSVSASNLDFERNHVDGSVDRYVRLRIVYNRGYYLPKDEPSYEGEEHHGLRIDFSMARIQRALQALNATAHEGASPGLTYCEIDIPAVAHTLPAAAAHAAVVVVIEPDAAVRSALCNSYLTLDNLECFGATDAEEALDWARTLPGEIDVVILPESAYSSHIQTLLEESPTTSVMLIRKNSASAPKLLEGACAHSTTIDSVFSHEQLRERLNRLLDARSSASMTQVA